MVPIYSFCNMHDISWGTKGLEAPIPLRERKIQAETLAKMNRQLSSGKDTAGAAGAGGGGGPSLRQSMADMQSRRQIKEQGQADLNKQKADREQTEDEFREFRTWVVSLWLITNFFLILVLSRECDEEAVFNEDYGMFGKIPGLCATTIARSEQQMSQVFTRGILFLAGCINAFRLTGSTYFLLVDKLERWLLRPWSCGPLCEIRRDPNKKRCIVLVVGLCVFLGGIVTTLELFEQRQDEINKKAWSDEIAILVDPDKDVGEFEKLHDDEKKLVMGMGVLATAGALCMLAAMGARPRFLRKPGEALATQEYDPNSNIFFSMGSGVLPRVGHDREAQIRRYKVWSCASGVASVLLLAWGALFVVMGTLQWLVIVGCTLFVLGVLAFLLTIRQLCRLQHAMRGTVDAPSVNPRLTGDE